MEREGEGGQGMGQRNGNLCGSEKQPGLCVGPGSLRGEEDEVRRVVVLVE